MAAPQLSAGRWGLDLARVGRKRRRRERQRYLAVGIEEEGEGEGEGGGRGEGEGGAGGGGEREGVDGAFTPQTTTPSPTSSESDASPLRSVDLSDPHRREVLQDLISIFDAAPQDVAGGLLSAQVLLDLRRGHGSVEGGIGRVERRGVGGVGGGVEVVEEEEEMGGRRGRKRRKIQFFDDVQDSERGGRGERRGVTRRRVAWELQDEVTSGGEGVIVAPAVPVLPRGYRAKNAIGGEGFGAGKRVVLRGVDGKLRMCVEGAVSEEVLVMARVVATMCLSKLPLNRDGIRATAGRQPPLLPFPHSRSRQWVELGELPDSKVKHGSALCPALVIAAQGLLIPWELSLYRADMHPEALQPFEYEFSITASPIPCTWTYQGAQGPPTAQRDLLLRGLNIMLRARYATTTPSDGIGPRKPQVSWVQGKGARVVRADRKPRSILNIQQLAALPDFRPPWAYKTFVGGE